jgi:hypothetical protein
VVGFEILLGHQSIVGGFGYVVHSNKGNASILGYSRNDVEIPNNRYVGGAKVLCNMIDRQLLININKEMASAPMNHVGRRTT